MTIPQRYQIFETPVFLSDKDAERLRIHLSNWNRLHEMLLLGVNAPDLRRLIVLEMMGAGRHRILTRLLGRLSKVERKEQTEKIKAALR